MLKPISSISPASKSEPGQLPASHQADVLLRPAPSARGRTRLHPAG